MMSASPCGIVLAIRCVCSSRIKSCSPAIINAGQAIVATSSIVILGSSMSIRVSGLGFSCVKNVADSRIIYPGLLLFMFSDVQGLVNCTVGTVIILSALYRISMLFRVILNLKRYNPHKAFRGVSGISTSSKSVSAYYCW